MKVTNRTLLFASFCLLVAALTERVAHTAAAAVGASRADQYGARHGTPPSPPPRAAPGREATDHLRSHANELELNAGPDRNHDNDRSRLSLVADPDATNSKHPKHGHDASVHDDDVDDAAGRREEDGMHTNELGEMQVGCGHGLFEVVPAPRSGADAGVGGDVGAAGARPKERTAIRKRAIDQMKDRKRRNYHSTFTVWQPPLYQLSRPYVIPVWGAQGQLPIYFPPQPIQPDALGGDPRKSYLPPKGYLPPVRTTTIGYDDDDDDNGSNPQSPGSTNINLDNRNSFDDAPIWDIEPPFQSRPPASRPPHRTTPAPASDQRRTRRPGLRTTTPPSLIHRSENNTNFNTNQRPNSLRPMSNRPNSAEASNFRPQQGGAFLGIVPQSTQRPATPQTPPPAQPSRAQPSRCVWAIISCCQGNTQNISYSCFEQLGCTGAFWDKSPCDSDFAKAAVDLALQYYSQK